MNQENSDQPLPDSVEEFLKSASELFEDAGDDSSNQSEFDNDDDKSNAAFAKMRIAGKKSKELLKKEHEEKMRLERELREARQGQSQQAPQGQSAGFDTVYVERLKMRAMQNLYAQNINPSTNPDLFQLEVNRIYNEDVSSFRQQETAKKNADSVVQSVISEFDEYDLDGSDEQTISERIGRLDVNSKADPDKVRQVVFGYLGENIAKFRNRDGNGHSKKGSAPPGVAAASEASKGVKVGTGSKAEKKTKPLSDKERKEMKKAGMPMTPESIERYRYAQTRKSNYQPT